MKHAFIGAVLLQNGEWGLSRTLTDVDYRQMKKDGDIQEFYSIEGKNRTYHIAFENDKGSRKEAKRIAIHVNRQRFGEQEPRTDEPTEFVKQHELPFEIMNTDEKE